LIWVALAVGFHLHALERHMAAPLARRLLLVIAVVVAALMAGLSIRAEWTVRGIRDRERGPGAAAVMAWKAPLVLTAFGAVGLAAFKVGAFMSAWLRDGSVSAYFWTDLPRVLARWVGLSLAVGYALVMTSSVVCLILVQAGVVADCPRQPRRCTVTTRRWFLVCLGLPATAPIALNLVSALSLLGLDPAGWIGDVLRFVSLPCAYLGGMFDWIFAYVYVPFAIGLGHAMRRSSKRHVLALVWQSPLLYAFLMLCLGFFASLGPDRHPRSAVTASAFMSVAGFALATGYAYVIVATTGYGLASLFGFIDDDSRACDAVVRGTPGGALEYRE